MVNLAIRRFPRCLALVLTLGLLVASGATAFAAARAELVGRAVLSADTLAPGPRSGARLNPAEANGRTVPFAGQPVQGISAVLYNGSGTYLVMLDNGYGAKGNSDDFNLRVYTVRPNFRTAAGGSGTVEVVGYFELSDPDRRVPWPIVNGSTPQRVLTGADFDPESMRRAPDGTLWFGDEFGPFLLHTDANGRLIEAPISLPVPATLAGAARGLPNVQSPDHPAFAGLPNADTRNTASNLGSSRGFEGMALSADGTRLYPLLEGALRDDPDRQRLVISEFDLASHRYTGRVVYYRLESPGNSIGDMTAINEREFLVIERDQEQGAKAIVKRIFKIDVGQLDAQGYAAKTDLLDLLNIADTHGLSGPPRAGALGLGNPFAFPFVTIESVLIEDSNTLLVINDNNYPFSAGRRSDAPDDEEFILLRLPEPLRLTSREARSVIDGTRAAAQPALPARPSTQLPAATVRGLPRTGEEPLPAPLAALAVVTGLALLGTGCRLRRR